MAVDPGRARYEAWYAWARFQSDEDAAAGIIARLLRVPVSDADGVDVHLVLGRIYKRRGERDKAIAEFTMASVVSLDCPEAVREIRRYESARDNTDHNSWSDDRAY